MLNLCGFPFKFTTCIINNIYSTIALKLKFRWGKYTWIVNGTPQVFTSEILGFPARHSEVFQLRIVYLPTYRTLAVDLQSNVIKVPSSPRDIMATICGHSWSNQAIEGHKLPFWLDRMLSPSTGLTAWKSSGVFLHRFPNNLWYLQETIGIPGSWESDSNPFSGLHSDFRVQQSPCERVHLQDADKYI